MAALTRRQILAGLAATGGTAAAGALPALAARPAAAGDPVADAFDRVIADAQAGKAAYLAAATPTPTGTATATATAKPAPTATATRPAPTATTVPPTATATPQPAGAGALRLVVPSYWGGDDTAIGRFVAAGAPAGTILCGGAGIRNDVDWRGGYREPWSAEQARRITAAHAGGLRVLNYIGIGELQGGVPPSTGGNWNDLGVVLGKIAYAFQLYPDLDGIYLDEFPYAGFVAELGQIRDAIRGRGKLIVGNDAGWQDFDTERDNSSYVDVLNVFERGWDRGDGGGPYFGNATGDDGYNQPNWFRQQVPAAKVSAWVYGVPDDAAQIARALTIARQQGVGNLYLTDRTVDSYTWGDCPSVSFMAKLFAAFKAQ